MNKIKLICPSCRSKAAVKSGKRKNKSQIVQRFKCNSCKKTFTNASLKNKTYPAKIILNALSFYNLGHSQQEASKIIAQKFKIQVPQRTISQWINECKTICTFHKLRKQALKLYLPKGIIHTQTLHHIQPYAFKFHKAKLDIVLQENPQFNPLKGHLEKITSEDFPHHIFTCNKSNENTTTQRASQLKFNHLKIEVKSKNNFACKLAKLALNLASANKQRHESIQDFMLINDSTTVAVEVPIYLTNWDAGYYRNQKGFIFPLSKAIRAKRL